MNKRLAIFLAAFVLVATVLTGCKEYENYTPSAADLTAIQEQYHGDDKQMVQETALARYLLAENARAESERAQAQIAQLEATKQAAAANERHQYVVLTAQAQDRERAAEARSVAETATAQYKSDVATATQQAWEGKVTATAESVQATAAAYSATATRAAEKREMTLGAARDFGIPLVLLVLGAGMIAFLVYAARQHAKRPVVYPRSILGDAEPMAVPVHGGGYTFIDLDRQPGPALQVLPSGQVHAPLLRPGPVEERVTARDQMVDAMSRPKLGGGHKAGQAPVLPAPPQAPAPGLRSVRVLRRLDQAGRAGFIAPPLLASIEADWEVEQ